MAGRMWDDLAPVVEETARKQGNTITQIDRTEAARWMKATQPVIDAWVKESKQRKFDGGALLAEAKALLAKFAGLTTPLSDIPASARRGAPQPGSAFMRSSQAAILGCVPAMSKPNSSAG